MSAHPFFPPSYQGRSNDWCQQCAPQRRERGGTSRRIIIDKTSRIRLLLSPPHCSPAAPELGCTDTAAKAGTRCSCSETESTMAAQPNVWQRGGRGQGGGDAPSLPPHTLTWREGLHLLRALAMRRAPSLPPHPPTWSAASSGHELGAISAAALSFIVQEPSEAMECVVAASSSSMSRRPRTLRRQRPGNMSSPPSWKHARHPPLRRPRRRPAARARGRASRARPLR